MYPLSALAALFCSASTEALYAYGHPITVPVDADPQKPLPREIVWVPVGEHEIYAHGGDMQPVHARVVGDAEGARSIIAHFETLRAAGARVWLDKNHEDAEATADVRGFAWDPARGVVATVEWTPYGERLLRDRVFCSFSPAFLRNKTTGRPALLMVGKSAGGLVNAPAFGAAMPALIAARLAGAELHATPVLAGSASDSAPAMNKELLIKIAAALGVTIAPDATPEQIDAGLTAALAKANTPTNASSSGAPAVAELEMLRAQLSTVRKDRAKTAVDAAVARGALPAKDEVIQAKWAGLIETDPSHEQLLASLPGNAALERKTEPGYGIVSVRDGAVDVLRALAATPGGDIDKRGEIYARGISPFFKDSNFTLGPILAANSLGTLAGELVTQRALTLLKREFPALNAISTDFSDEVIAFNQTIRARLRTLPVIGDYVPGTGYTAGDAGATDVPMIIDGHKHVTISFNVNELGATNRDLFGEQTEGAHNTIGGDLMDLVLGCVTVGNFANATTKALVSFDRATLTTVGKALTGRKVPKQGRFAMLNLDYYEKLGQDTAIVSLATQQQREIITENLLPRVAKFQPYEVDCLPVAANLQGFCGTPDSLVVATRVPGDYTKAMPDIPSTASVQYVKNPDTGITVMMVRFIDHTKGAAVWRLAYMRGAAKGNPASGQRIVSA